MNCDNCGGRDATVHLTEVVNDKVNKLHLCEECARKKSEEMQSHFGLTDLLSGLMDFGPSLPDDELGTDTKVKCVKCKLTYPDFQKTGRLGCGTCYKTFSKPLGDLLRKIHGSETHVGKMPFMGEEVLVDQQEYKRLKDELNVLIQAEEFEKAALLRDRIKDLEKKIDNKG